MTQALDAPMNQGEVSDERLAADLSGLDRATEQWAQHVGWRQQLDQITAISTGIAGNRVNGDGGAELKMLILRQRNLIDRWVRQAFGEGLLAREAANERLAELEALLDLRWEADMRAIKRWQEANPGNDLVWPDYADLVVWLMGELDTELKARRHSGAKAGDAAEAEDIARKLREWPGDGEMLRVRAARFLERLSALSPSPDGGEAVAIPEHLSPLPWSYHNNRDGQFPRDYIEDALGNVVVEHVGHIDGPFIVKAANSHAPARPELPDGELDQGALEAAAKAIHDHWQNAPHGRSWEETCDKLPRAADDFRAKATEGIRAYLKSAPLPQDLSRGERERGWQEREINTFVGLGVDSQVMTAARDDADEYRNQPTWLWFEGDRETLAFGRWNKVPGQAAYIRADLALRALSEAGKPDTKGERRYRHKKRGTEYVLIGIGKMQAEEWRERGWNDVYQTETFSTKVDLREVAIYRSATDPTEFWVRPREEFEDGRFEALPDTKEPGNG